MAQKITYKQLGDDILASYYHLIYLRHDTIGEVYNQVITVGREKVRYYNGTTIDARIAPHVKSVHVLDELDHITGIATVKSYDITADTFQMYLQSYKQSDVVIDDTAASTTSVYSSAKVESLISSSITAYYETQGVLSEKMIGNSSVININDINPLVKVNDIVYDTDCILGLVIAVDTITCTVTIETVFSADVESSLIGVIFETLHNYTVGDIIVRNNKLYRCVVAYTSTTSFDTDLANGYWSVMDIVLNGGEIV